MSALVQQDEYTSLFEREREREKTQDAKKFRVSPVDSHFTMKGHLKAVKRCPGFTETTQNNMTSIRKRERERERERESEKNTRLIDTYHHWPCLRDLEAI